LGDSALTVDILVALINTLGLTELVSDSLVSRKQKEAETNAKIVDLFKDALDEIKNCRTEQQTLKQIHGMGTRRYVLSVDNDNEFRSRCE
jgi:cell shape-determining protein MreC